MTEPSDPLPSSKTQHVVPIDDILPHVYRSDCPCKPEIEEVVIPGGFLVIHNAWDGRPQKETPPTS